MGGTYNEVEVKKLGSKPPAKKKKPASRASTTQTPAFASASASAPANEDVQQAAAWPSALQDFVNRSFEQSETLLGPAKAAFNEQIQALIYSAAREKKIWTNDWAAQKLPIFDASVPLALHQDYAVFAAPTPTNSVVQHEHQHQPHPQPQPQTFASNSHLEHGKSAKYDSNERKRQRAARFQDSATRSPSPVPVVTSAPAANSSHIVGTSTELEKRYLRLTSEPDPSVVRPANILGVCLSHVVDKYRSTGASYSYINDQLKAIRQDLTVQHIKGPLAIRVYEVHGRIAIENNDLGEFNQCQAQLKHLYAANSKPSFYKKTYEFTCYRILYLLITQNFADINLTRLELLAVDSAVNEESLDAESQVRRQCLYKALDLADHVTLGNFHGFFVLYKWYKGLDCMEGAFHLIEQFMANKQRVLSLNTMCKAFKKLPLSYLEEQLALNSTSQFLTDYGLNSYISGQDFDCSAARMVLQGLVDQGKFKKVDIKGQV